jgi:hypothetical protein
VQKFRQMNLIAILFGIKIAHQLEQLKTVMGSLVPTTEETKLAFVTIVG